MHLSLSRQERRSDNLSQYAIARDKLRLASTPFARGGSGVVYRGWYCETEVRREPETRNPGPETRNPKS